MFHNTPKSLNFRGVLSCNALRGGDEKLSTIGPEYGEKLSCPGLAWYGFWVYICKRKMWGEVGVCPPLSNPNY